MGFGQGEIGWFGDVGEGDIVRAGGGKWEDGKGVKVSKAGGG